LLQKGDVIISGRGTTVKVAVVGKDMPKLIISGNLICTRLDRKLVNPYFLRIYFESEVGKALLEAHPYCSGYNGS
jgi:type I restriction enzyme M protein